MTDTLPLNNQKQNNVKLTQRQIFGKKFIEWNMYACDFETFTSEGEYYQKHHRTDVYCVVAKWLELDYNKYSKKYEPALYDEEFDKDRKYRFNRKAKFRGFTNITDYIEAFSNGDIYGRHQIHFFHNGVNFDFNFIEDWLKAQKKFSFYEGEKQTEELLATQSEMCGEIAFYDYSKNFKSNMIFICLYIPYYSQNDKKWRLTTIKFFDSLKYFPGMSIKEMGKTLNEMDPDTYPKELFDKPDFDMNKVKEVLKCYEFLPEDVRVRCETDVRILQEFLKHMFSLEDFLCKGTRIPMTAASLTLMKILECWKEMAGAKTKAQKRNLLFKTLEIKEKDLEKLSEINREFLNKRWYRGGICTYNEKLKTEEIVNKLIYGYDVNSLYPSVMVKYLPVGLPSLETVLTNQIRQSRFVFVLFKADKMVQNDREKLPPFLSEFWAKSIFKIDEITEEELAKMEINYEEQVEYVDYETEANISSNIDDELDLENQREIGHYFFELNKVETCVSLEEFEILLKMCSFKNLQVKYLVFNRKKLFDGFINYFYPKKVACGKDPSMAMLKITFKLFLNSGYGKFAQRVLMEIGVFIKDGQIYQIKNAEKIQNQKEIRSNSSYARYTVIGENNNSYVPLSAAITSLARTVLMKKAYETAQKGYYVYYCDTDSIKTDCPVEEFGDVDNEALGKWKFEGWVKHFKVFKPKFYFGSQDGIKIYDKFMGSAGVKKDVLLSYTYPQVTEDMEITMKMKKRVEGGVVLIEQQKKVKSIMVRFK